jgi:hypothetical protein
VAPDAGHAKFMSLAQLFCGREALELYSKGIMLATRALDEAKAAKGEPFKKFLCCFSFNVKISKLNSRVLRLLSSFYC